MNSDSSQRPEGAGAMNHENKGSQNIITFACQKVFIASWEVDFGYLDCVFALGWCYTSSQSPQVVTLKIKWG